MNERSVELSSPTSRVRMRPRTFILGLFIILPVAVALVVLYYYKNAYCPCGFEFDPLTGGCKVVLGPVDCGNGAGAGASPGGGAPVGGGTAHKDPSGGFVPPVGINNYCIYRVTNCMLNPQKTAISYTVENHTEVFHTGGDGPTLKVSILQSPCANIKGTVVAPGPNGGNQSIPLAHAAIDMYPGLNGVFNGPCPGSPTTIVVNPDLQPKNGHTPQECGCTAQFN